MVILWPTVGMVSVAVTLLVFVAGWLWRRRTTAVRTDVLASHVERMRRLPRYQVLARRHARLLLVQLVCWLLVAVGAGMTMSRLVSVDDQAREMRTRDVVLCLDVSDSMAGIDIDVLSSYLKLVDSLTDERIGFVVFDSAAVSVFPLTQDRAFMTDKLTQMRDSLRKGSTGVKGVLAGGEGSSLIGDGLASCLSHFDQLDVVRSRTVVLATDNMVSGKPIYTLEQATNLAVDKQVMVFGVLPADQNNAEAQQLHDQAVRTHGDTLAITPGRASNVDLITRQVQAQARHALVLLPTHRSFDLVWPGTVVMLAATIASAVARRKEHR